MTRSELAERLEALAQTFETRATSWYGYSRGEEAEPDLAACELLLAASEVRSMRALLAPARQPA